MDFLDQINIQPHIFIQFFRFPGNQLGKRLGIEQFKYRSIALSHPHHIIGNGSRNAQNKGPPGQIPLPVNIGQGVGIEIYFDNGIRIQPVYLAIGPLTDHLAALHRKLTICLFHRHHFGKARHLQNFVYAGLGMDDPEPRLVFPEAKDDTQPGAGDIIQLFRIQNDLSFRISLPKGQNLRLSLERISGINMANERNNAVVFYHS